MHTNISDMSTGEQWYFYRFSWFSIIGIMLIGLVISAMGILGIQYELNAMPAEATPSEMVQRFEWVLVLPAVSPLFMLITWPSICVALKGQGFMVWSEDDITLWTGFFSPKQVTIPFSEIKSVKVRAYGNRSLSEYLLGFRTEQKSYSVSRSFFRSRSQFNEVAEALIAGAALNKRHESSWAKDTSLIRLVRWLPDGI